MHDFGFVYRKRLMFSSDERLMLAKRTGLGLVLEGLLSRVLFGDAFLTLCRIFPNDNIAEVAIL